MKLLDRLLGRKTEDPRLEQARTIIREQERIGDLCTSMTSVALHVGEFLKPQSTAPTKEGKGDQWFWAQVEVLHFLLHMMNRVALKKLGTERRRLLADQAAPRVFHAFVETLCVNLSQKEKEDLRTHLLEQTQERELQYAKCLGTVGDPEKDLFDTRNLFALVTQLVLEAAGSEIEPSLGVCDPQLFFLLHLKVFELYGEMKLDDKVLVAGEGMSPRA